MILSKRRCCYTLFFVVYFSPWIFSSEKQHLTVQFTMQIRHIRPNWHALWWCVYSISAILWKPIAWHIEFDKRISYPRIPNHSSRSGEHLQIFLIIKTLVVSFLPCHVTSMWVTTIIYFTMGHFKPMLSGGPILVSTVDNPWFMSWNFRLPVL